MDAGFQNQVQVNRLMPFELYPTAPCHSLITDCDCVNGVFPNCFILKQMLLTPVIFIVVIMGTEFQTAT